MKNTSYKRGQVEWALWQFFRAKSNAKAKPPLIFSTRIKRLLELDRAGVKNTPGYAFAESGTFGRGSDAAFSAFDAFCLAIAMDMLDTGFKQSEIVFFLAHIRPHLLKEYKYIIRNQHPSRQQAVEKEFPNLPKKINDEGIADPLVYLVTRKIELKEIFPNKLSQESNEPLILEPGYFRGLAELVTELNANPKAYRKVLLVELSQTANEITDFLKQAPEFRRGRP